MFLRLYHSISCQYSKSISTRVPMIRRTIKVILTPLEREQLEKIVAANNTSKYDKIKAHILLLTDISELGPKKFSKDVAAELDISERCVCRIRQLYAKNKSIQDVFIQEKIEAKIEQQSNIKVEVEAAGNNSNNSKMRKKKQYLENTNCQIEGIKFEHVKYRVTLTDIERKILKDIIKSGKHSDRKLNRAKILLHADEGSEGPAMTDEEIANKLDVSISTINRVRRLFFSKCSLEEVLSFKHYKAGRHPKIDGTLEATLIATVCSSPPEGCCRWTLRLLADRLIQLEHVASISHVAIGNALKKMSSSPGKKGNG